MFINARWELSVFSKRWTIIQHVTIALFILRVYLVATPSTWGWITLAGAWYDNLLSYWRFKIGRKPRFTLKTQLSEESKGRSYLLWSTFENPAFSITWEIVYWTKKSYQAQKLLSSFSSITTFTSLPLLFSSTISSSTILSPPFLRSVYWWLPLHNWHNR